MLFFSDHFVPVLGLKTDLPLQMEVFLHLEGEKKIQLFLLQLLCLDVMNIFDTFLLCHHSKHTLLSYTVTKCFAVVFELLLFKLLSVPPHNLWTIWPYTFFAIDKAVQLTPIRHVFVIYSQKAFVGLGRASVVPAKTKRSLYCGSMRE